MKLYSVYYKNDELTKKEELEKKDGVYRIEEYEGIIGVSCDEAITEVIVTTSEPETKFSLKYVEEDKIWIPENHKTSGPKRGEKDAHLFGVNACGEFEIISYEGKKAAEHKPVTIIPGSMSLKEYKSMQDEIKYLYNTVMIESSFVTNKEHSVQTEPAFEETKIRENIDYISKEPKIEDIENFIKELRIVLEHILESPNETLSIRKTYARSKREEGFSPIDLAKAPNFPDTLRVRVKEVYRDMNIPEHKMISGFLNEIEDYLVEIIGLEQIKYREYRAEMHNIEKNGDEKDEEVKERLKKLKKAREISEGRKNKLESQCEEIEMIRDYSLFQVEPYEFRYTHLLNSHPAYIPICDLYERFMRISKGETRRRRKEMIEALLKSPTLYEIWILVKLLREIEKIGFVVNITDSHPSKDILNDYFMEKNTLKGFSVDYIYKYGNKGDREIEVKIYYEPEIMENGQLGGELKGKYKPDYILLYKSTEEWQGHFLDAKYKCYPEDSEISDNRLGQSELQKHWLDNDIKHSAERYLKNIPTFQDKRRNLKAKTVSAAIVHTTPNASNWNVDKTEERTEFYKTAHFNQLPYDNDKVRANKGIDMNNLNTWLKRTLHYFGETFEICPTCGRKDGTIEEKGKTIYKTTYKCDGEGGCKTVWVKNSCKKEFECDFPTLMKYSAGNYNLPVEGEWNVYCPKCDREVNGNLAERTLMRG